MVVTADSGGGRVSYREIGSQSGCMFVLVMNERNVKGVLCFIGVK